MRQMKSDPREDHDPGRAAGDDDKENSSNGLIKNQTLVGVHSGVAGEQPKDHERRSAEDKNGGENSQDKCECEGQLKFGVGDILSSHGTKYTEIGKKPQAEFIKIRTLCFEKDAHPGADHHDSNRRL